MFETLTRSVPPRFASPPPVFAGAPPPAELAKLAPTSSPAPSTAAASDGKSFFCIGLPFGSRPPGGGHSLQGVRRKLESLVRVNYGAVIKARTVSVSSAKVNGFPRNEVAGGSAPGGQILGVPGHVDDLQPGL